MAQTFDDQPAYRPRRVRRRRFVVGALTLASTGVFSMACRNQSPQPQAPAAKTDAKPAEAARPAEAKPAEAAKPTDTQAPAKPAAATGGRLVVAGAKDIRTLDPVQNNDADSTYVYTQVHDSVARIDPQFNIQPALAESWDTSPNGLTYTYRFRKGVSFHDGSTMTADDVVFSIDRIMADRYPEGRKKEKIEMIDSYKKVDDATVEIKLKFPYAPFAAAFGAQMIVPKAAVERLGEVEFARKPIGAGPFRAVEWVPNDHVTLRGFED